MLIYEIPLSGTLTLFSLLSSGVPVLVRQMKLKLQFVACFRSEFMTRLGGTIGLLAEV